MKDIILRWDKLTTTMSARIDEFESIIGCDANSPIISIMYSLHEELTQCVAREIGDTNRWLEWYAWDNLMGSRKLEAGFDDNIKPIASIEDLIWLIDECKSSETK